MLCASKNEAMSTAEDGATACVLHASESEAMSATGDGAILVATPRRGAKPIADGAQMGSRSWMMLRWREVSSRSCGLACVLSSGGEKGEGMEWSERARSWVRHALSA